MFLKTFLLILNGPFLMLVASLANCGLVLTFGLEAHIGCFSQMSIARWVSWRAAASFAESCSASSLDSLSKLILSIRVFDSCVIRFLTFSHSLVRFSCGGVEVGWLDVVHHSSLVFFFCFGGFWHRH